LFFKGLNINKIFPKEYSLGPLYFICTATASESEIDRIFYGQIFPAAYSEEFQLVYYIPTGLYFMNLKNTFDGDKLC